MVASQGLPVTALNWPARRPLAPLDMMPVDTAAVSASAAVAAAAAAADDNDDVAAADVDGVVAAVFLVVHCSSPRARYMKAVAGAPCCSSMVTSE